MSTKKQIKKPTQKQIAMTKRDDKMDDLLWALAMCDPRDDKLFDRLLSGIKSEDDLVDMFGLALGHMFLMSNRLKLARRADLWMGMATDPFASHVDIADSLEDTDFVDEVPAPAKRKMAKKP
jgi:hypothetical protein